MEGASWVAKKGVHESNRFAQNLYNLVSEYDRRAQMCITDETINEVDGLKFNELKEWIQEAVASNGKEIQQRFETLLENVNYNLSEANKAFGVQGQNSIKTR